MNNVKGTMYTHLFRRVNPAFWLLARIQGWKEDKMLVCPVCHHPHSPPPPPPQKKKKKKNDAEILTTGIFDSTVFIRLSAQPRISAHPEGRKS